MRGCLTYISCYPYCSMSSRPSLSYSETEPLRLWVLLSRANKSNKASKNTPLLLTLSLHVQAKRSGYIKSGPCSTRPVPPFPTPLHIVDTLSKCNSLWISFAPWKSSLIRNSQFESWIKHLVAFSTSSTIVAASIYVSTVIVFGFYLLASEDIVGALCSTRKSCWSCICGSCSSSRSKAGATRSVLVVSTSWLLLELCISLVHRGPSKHRS